MKTIYINGKFLCQKITGVQRFAIETIKVLDKNINTYNDIEIIIIAPNGIINDLKLDNIKIISIGGKPNYFWEQITLPKYCKKHKCDDLLNLCNIAPIRFPGSCVIHDLAVIQAKKGYRLIQRLIYRFINKKNIKKYKNIFTDSEVMKNEIINFYKLKKDNITVLRCGFEQVLSFPYEEVKNLPEHFYFAVGSQNPNKNFDYIIELAKNNQNKNFVIAGGSGKCFKKMELEAPKNMMFLGYVTDGNLRFCYEKCDGFIFPSLYEGFGIPPLEAIALGCKCVYLSNLPVLKEIYGDIGVSIEDSNYKVLNNYKIVDKALKDQLLKKYTWDYNKIILKKYDN